MRECPKIFQTSHCHEFCQSVVKCFWNPNSKSYPPILIPFKSQCCLMAQCRSWKYFWVTVYNLGDGSGMDKPAILTIDYGHNTASACTVLLCDVQSSDLSCVCYTFSLLCVQRLIVNSLSTHDIWLIGCPSCLVSAGNLWGHLLVCAAASWNSLPDSFTDTLLSLSCFQNQLQTFFSNLVTSTLSMLQVTYSLYVTRCADVAAERNSTGRCGRSLSVLFDLTRTRRRCIRRCTSVSFSVKSYQSTPARISRRRNFTSRLIKTPIGSVRHC